VNLEKEILPGSSHESKQSNATGMPDAPKHVWLGNPHNPVSSPRGASLPDRLFRYAERGDLSLEDATMIGEAIATIETLETMLKWQG